ncbi:MAG: hypothetical protein LBT83_07205 [Tannerella sp.]|jgi:hypothetical protein|nr:hypothetical protein [Tannerella sp.]
MAKKKKKAPSGKSPDVRKRILNKTFIDKACVAIKKILRAYGLDPDIFDRLSKTQRNVFILTETDAPRFKVAEGSHMPRQLVEMINQSTHHFLRNNYYGDESIGLTYLEMATFGVTFYSQILVVHDENDRGFPPEQMKIVDAIAEKFMAYSLYNALEAIGVHLRKSVQMISKVNFRIYGYEWRIPSEYGRGYFKSTVFFYSEESEHIYFKYKNQFHKAFHVKAGRVNSHPFHGAEIDHRFIFPERFDEKFFDIYIQSHALHRIKERVDIFPAHKRNFYVMDTLLYMHRIVYNSHGRAMLECYHDDVLFGYYPFTIQQNKIFILSFLPVIALDTPTGELIERRLHLQKEDTIYLGMDKLSFFFTVDFSQIPTLYNVLVEAKLKPLLDFDSEDRFLFEHDPKKTLMVKKFFEQSIK